MERTIEDFDARNLQQTALLPKYIITKESVKLFAIFDQNKELLTSYYNSITDNKITVWKQPPENVKQLADKLNNVYDNWESNDEIIYTINMRERDRIVGEIRITNVDWEQSKFEMYISMLESHHYEVAPVIDIILQIYFNKLSFKLARIYTYQDDIVDNINEYIHNQNGVYEGLRRYTTNNKCNTWSLFKDEYTSQKTTNENTNVEETIQSNLTNINKM